MINDVREISRIAYGFKASKALFVALELEIFGRIASSPKSLLQLAAETSVAENRLGNTARRTHKHRIGDKERRE